MEETRAPVRQGKAWHPRGCQAGEVRSHSLVFGRDLLVGVIRQQRGRDDADDRACQDVERDRQRRAIRREQPRRDERRRTAGDDRGKLVAERRAAVAQPRREASAISAACGPYIMS